VISIQIDKNCGGFMHFTPNLYNIDLLGVAVVVKELSRGVVVGAGVVVGGGDVVGGAIKTANISYTTLTYCKGTLRTLCDH
jgi:hypothetical protein